MVLLSEKKPIVFLRGVKKVCMLLLPTAKGCTLKDHVPHRRGWLTGEVGVVIGKALHGGGVAAEAATEAPPAPIP